jgi:hypothetical protein
MLDFMLELNSRQIARMAVANVFVVIDDRTVSAAHAFIAALYAPYGDSAGREVAFLDLARVAVKLVEVPDMDYDASYLRRHLSS